MEQCKKCEYAWSKTCPPLPEEEAQHCNMFADPPPNCQCHKPPLLTGRQGLKVFRLLLPLLVESIGNDKEE